jgi:hypothetical protein
VNVKRDLVAPILHQPHDLLEQIEPEHAGAERLDKHHARQAMTLEDFELIAQPTLAL